MPAPDNWLYNYQTLVTGLLAVGAALWTVRLGRQQIAAVDAQIMAAKAQADDDRTRRLRAARASLPAVLSAVCDYSEDAGRALHAIWNTEQWQLANADQSHLAAPCEPVQIPAFPDAAIQTFGAILELADDATVIGCIESMLSEVQILTARVRGLHEQSSISTHYMSELIQQAATIYGSAALMFRYSRRQTDVIDGELWPHVDAALSEMGIHEPVISLAWRRERDQGLPAGAARAQLL